MVSWKKTESDEATALPTNVFSCRSPDNDYSTRTVTGYIKLPVHEDPPSDYIYIYSLSGACLVSIPIGCLEALEGANY